MHSEKLFIFIKQILFFSFQSNNILTVYGRHNSSAYVCAIYVSVIGETTYVNVTEELIYYQKYQLYVTDHLLAVR